MEGRSRRGCDLWSNTVGLACRDTAEQPDDGALDLSRASFLCDHKIIGKSHHAHHSSIGSFMHDQIYYIRLAKVIPFLLEARTVHRLIFRFGRQEQAKSHANTHQWVLREPSTLT
jgi:hypothetical protein